MLFCPKASLVPAGSKEAFLQHWRHFRGRRLSVATPVLLELPLAPSPARYSATALCVGGGGLKGGLCPPCRRAAGWAALRETDASQRGVKSWPG